MVEFWMSGGTNIKIACLLRLKLNAKLEELKWKGEILGV